MIRTAPFALLLLVALGTLGGCATTGADKDAQDAAAEEVPLEQLLAEANESLRKGDLDSAQVGFALAAERDPGNPDTLYKLGIIHREKGNLPVAEGLLHAALGASPQHQGAREALGIVLLEQERLDEAEERLLVALEGRPDSWQVMNALGVINDMRSRHTEAQELFTAALFVAPRSAKISNNLGYSYYLAGDYDRAEKHIRNATRLDSEYGRAWSNLALVYARLGRYRDATAAFDRIVERHQSANNLGYLGLLEDNPRLARVQLERAVRLSPSYYALANDNLSALNDRGPRLAGDAVKTSDRRLGLADDQKPLPKALLGRAPMQSSIVPVIDANPALEGAAVTEVDDSPSLVAVGTSDTPLRQTLVLDDAQTARRVASSIVRVRAAAAARRPVNTKAATASNPLRATLAFVGFGTDDDSEQALQGAVENFQKTYDLKADGRVGRRTQAKLDELAITRLQTKLLALGYESGKTDGRLGRLTRKAIRAFEKEESLPVTGRPNKAVFERIELAFSRASEMLNSDERLDYSSRG